MAYKSSTEGTELTFLRTKTLTPMMLSPSVKKKKNRNDQDEEGNQLVSTLFCSNVAKQTVNEIPAQRN